MLKTKGQVGFSTMLQSKTQVTMALSGMGQWSQRAALQGTLTMLKMKRLEAKDSTTMKMALKKKRMHSLIGSQRKYMK